MKMKKSTIRMLLLLTLSIVALITFPSQRAFAATAVKICAVSYEDESILVFTNGNPKLLYATEKEAAQGKWDIIDVKRDISNNLELITAIDISFLSPNSENIIMVKGSSDQTQARVIIKAKPQKLQVSINYSNMESILPMDPIGSMLNIMTSEGNGDKPITIKDLEWRKGKDGHWMSTDLLTRELLESYLIRGTFLNFRIAAIDDVVSAGTTDATDQIRDNAVMYPYTNKFGVNTASDFTFDTDYPDGLDGRRASDEVKLKIAKKQALPVSGIDGSKFKANIKYGQEYRVTVNNGTTPNYWTKVTDRAIKGLPLSTMTGGTSDGLTNSFPNLLIEIRDYATAKAAASKIIETNIDAQRVLSANIVEGPAPVVVNTTDPNIYISYNGTKSVQVTIPSASVANPYEYCVVIDGDTFDLNRVSWTAISKNTGLSILSSKAIEKSTLYIRMKEVKYKPATSTSGAVAFKLASTYKTFTVKYPSMPTAPKKTYVYTKKYTTALDPIIVTLNENGKMPYETGLRYVKIGTMEVPVKSVVVTPTITGSPNPNQVYTMTIMLSESELEKMTNCTDRVLSLYYNNGTVDKTSSKLTIKNATSSGTLTATPAKGTVAGSTSITVTSNPATGNMYVYILGATEVKDKNVEDTITGGTAFTSGTDIAVGTNKYLTIYEVSSTAAVKNIIKYKCIEITSTIVQ